MQGKYYSTKVRPTIPASSQNAAAYTAKDVLFGWTAVQIPRGSARLISVTAIVRGKGDANGTANPFAMDLWFADDDRNALAASNVVTNAANAGIPTRDLLGNVSLEVAGYAELGDNNMAQVVTSGHTSGTSLVGDFGEAVDFQFNYGSSIDNLVITPKMTLDVNASPTVMGYSTFYMAGIAQGAFDFRNVCAIAEDTAAGAAAAVAITTDGAVSEIEQFAIGDVLHIGTSAGEPAADSPIGTVAAVVDDLVTLESASETLLVDGDILYNIHPVEIVLAFEY